MRKNILYVSGGEYGDLYGGPLASALKEILPSVTVKISRGPGSPGVDNQADGPDNLLDNARFDCLLLVDRPLFDIRLIRKAKAKHIPVIYYAGAYAGPLKTKTSQKTNRARRQGPGRLPL